MCALSLFSIQTIKIVKHIILIICFMLKSPPYNLDYHLFLRLPTVTIHRTCSVRVSSYLCSSSLLGVKQLIFFSPYRLTRFAQRHMEYAYMGSLKLIFLFLNGYRAIVSTSTEIEEEKNACCSLIIQFLNFRSSIKRD